MNIGLHDADGHSGFPNLALMKLSAWHKAQGDEVSWWSPEREYDKVYSSKVFTFTKDEPLLPVGTIRGGTGYGKYEDLPAEIDRMFPDYSLYPNCDYAIGFLTRGCVRKCPWCVVPKKEGWIRPYMTWREIKRPDSRDIKFMDNNVLACDFGREQMIDMIGQNVRVDFNQGLDARLVDDDVADILSRLKWIRFIRFSCDTDAMLDLVLQKIDLLKRHGVKPYRIFVYVLVQDIESAEKRAIALRSAGVDVFAQPYRDFTTNEQPPLELRRFARWVNLKQVFKTVERFADFEPSMRAR